MKTYARWIIPALFLIGIVVTIARYRMPVEAPELLNAALARAKTENKNVLLDFTGSDWCGPCMVLREKVFESEQFTQWAKSRLIFIEVDFPAQKKLSEDVERQNALMKRKYQVDGYPTIVVVNHEGKELARTVGYRGEDAEAWIAALQRKIEGQ